VFARVLGDASAERDASRTRVDAVRWDYSIRVSISSSQSKWRRALGQMLDERVVVLGL
jgi:hypothetical protein